MMNKEEYDEKSLALTRKIHEIEWLEEDVLSMKRRHEHAVSDLQSEFHHLSRAVDSLLNQAPEEYAGKYKDVQANADLTRQMDRYADEHLEQVSVYTMNVRRQLDDKREDYIKERNRLKWE